MSPASSYSLLFPSNLVSVPYHQASNACVQNDLAFWAWCCLPLSTHWNCRAKCTQDPEQIPKAIISRENNNIKQKQSGRMIVMSNEEALKGSLLGVFPLFEGNLVGELLLYFMWSINLPRMIYFMLESIVVPDKNAILPRATKTEKRPKGQMKTAHYHLHIFAIERYRRYRSRQVNSLEFRRWTQYVQWPQQSLHKCKLSLQIRFVNHGGRTRDSSNNTQLCSLDPGPDF